MKKLIVVKSHEKFLMDTINKVLYPETTEHFNFLLSNYHKFLFTVKDVEADDILYLKYAELVEGGPSKFGDLYLNDVKCEWVEVPSRKELLFPIFTPVLMEYALEMGNVFLVGNNMKGEDRVITDPGLFNIKVLDINFPEEVTKEELLNSIHFNDDSDELCIINSTFTLLENGKVIINTYHELMVKFKSYPLGKIMAGDYGTIQIVRMWDQSGPRLTEFDYLHFISDRVLNNFVKGNCLEFSYSTL